MPLISVKHVHCAVIDSLTASLSAPAFRDDCGVLSELCATLSRLAVRNEFCQEIVDLGGLNFLVTLLADCVEHPVSCGRSFGSGLGGTSHPEQRGSCSRTSLSLCNRGWNPSDPYLPHTCRIQCSAGKICAFFTQNHPCALQLPAAELCLLPEKLNAWFSTKRRFFLVFPPERF